MFLFINNVELNGNECFLAFSSLGTPKLSTTTTVRIRVRDVNDNAPEIIVPQENDAHAFRVNAKALERTLIGRVR